MYRYSRHSRTQRGTLHPVLVKILDKTLELHDFKILQGGRTRQEQQKLFDMGYSKLAPPEGKHLIQEDGYSWAADIVPFVSGKEIETSSDKFRSAEQAKFAHFLGIVRGVAVHVLDSQLAHCGKEYKLRFGINWDMDEEILTDQNFDDWFHVELMRVG